MKKMVIYLTLVTVLSAAIPSEAADFTAGVSTWYANWQVNNSSDETIDPGLLYGPVVAAKINDDFAFNLVFLYGNFDAKQSFGKYNYDRYDSDTSLSYRLNGYFKLFGGFKYNAYKSTFPLPLGDAELDFESIGPAAGLSCVFPLYVDFFLLANTSVMYLWSHTSMTGTSDTTGNVYGSNSAVSLAYYINSASVTLSLGGRYQHLKMHPDDNSGDSTMNFYGITASATYSFDI